MTAKTKVFHGGKFTSKSVKTSADAALKEKEKLKSQGKKVRITRTMEGKTKIHRIWVK